MRPATVIYKGLIPRQDQRDFRQWKQTKKLWKFKKDRFQVIVRYYNGWKRRIYAGYRKLTNVAPHYYEDNESLTIFQMGSIILLKFKSECGFYCLCEDKWYRQFHFISDELLYWFQIGPRPSQIAFRSNTSCAVYIVYGSDYNCCYHRSIFNDKDSIFLNGYSIFKMLNYRIEQAPRIFNKLLVKEQKTAAETLLALRRRGALALSKDMIKLIAVSLGHDSDVIDLRF